MKKMLIVFIGFLFLMCLNVDVRGAVLISDDIPSGSISTWTYQPHDPCTGTRAWNEVISPFDGTTAIETYMAGCGGTCGSYNLYKDYFFGSPIDKNATTVNFDGQFELLRSISHNRAQIQFSFYNNGVNIGQVNMGYDRFGQTYNVPAGNFASGNWTFDLMSLSDNPDQMRVLIHTRSCVAGDGRVTLDNIKVETTPVAVPQTIIFQPCGGLNDGTDDGSVNAGKDAGTWAYSPGSSVYSATSTMEAWISNCNGGTGYTHLEFNLDCLPAADVVTNVKLRFFLREYTSYWGYTRSTEIWNLLRITQPWNEMGITHSNMPATALYSSFTINPTAGVHTAPTNWTVFAFDDYVELDVTSLYKDWKNGVVPNYGVSIRPTWIECNNGNTARISTSDELVDVAKRPALIIEHTEADTADTDGDGVVNSSDNCRCTPNPDQADNDGDGIGDECDCDDDNDGIPDVDDNCPFTPNSDQVDADGDGIGDVCDTNADADGDGYNSDEDCNDADATINPGAEEVLYNGIDDDCNPATPDTVDADGDGYNSDEDCNDVDALINPGLTEVLYNGVDDDCDSATPDTVDADGDGFNSNVDCNDSDATINPGTEELLYNGINDDCDPATPDTVDADGDGYNSDVDCNDADASINPGAEEVKNNGIDDDCNPGTLDHPSQNGAHGNNGIHLGNDMEDNHVDSGNHKSEGKTKKH